MEYVEKVFILFIEDLTDNKELQSYLRKTFDISTGLVPNIKAIISSELDVSLTY